MSNHERPQLKEKIISATSTPAGVILAGGAPGVILDRFGSQAPVVLSTVTALGVGFVGIWLIAFGVKHLAEVINVHPDGDAV